MKTLRALAVPALLAGTLLAPQPASAAVEEAFTGTVTFACFGCGRSYGTAQLSFLSGTAYAEFEVDSPPQLCPAFTIMTGEMEGAIPMRFTWTATTGAMVIDGSGGGRIYRGASAFTVDGNPCGGNNAVARVVGVVVGVP